jgi:muconate cycloisomerase
VAGLRYLEGSFDRYLVRERLTREDLTFKHGGWAHAINAPGLGVDIDPSALRRVTFAEDHWLAR